MEEIISNDNLQPTFLEHFLHKHNNRTTIVNNQTNVIVANKAMAALTPIPNTNQNFEPIVYNNNKSNNNIQNDDNQTNNFNINQPSPPPLRRLRSRCIVNPSNDTNTLQQHNQQSEHLPVIKNGETLRNDLNEKSDDDDKNNSITATSPITSSSKRSLPHKKRITKKMKNLNKQQQQQFKDDINKINVITTSTNTNTINLNTNNNITNNVNTKDLQFKCQLCGLLSECQFDFFAHLKSHYEPAPMDEENIEEKCVNNQQEIQHKQQPVIIFNANNINKLETINDNEIEINNGKTLTKQYNTKNKRKKSLMNNNLKKNNKNIINDNDNNVDLLSMPIPSSLTPNTTQTIILPSNDMHLVDNLHATIILPTMSSSPVNTKIDTMLEEFSEPEDMLEGIRNVVQNVQDTIDETTQLDQFLMNKIDDKKSDSNDNTEITQSKTIANNLSLKKKLHATDDFLLKLTNKYKIRDEVYYEYEDNVNNHEGVINRIINNPDEDNNLIINLNKDCKSNFDYHDDDGDEDDDNNKEETKIDDTSDDVSSDDDKMETTNGTTEDTANTAATSTGSNQPKSYIKKRRRCDICGKSFNSKNASQYHKLSHTGERPHQCDVCGKRFYSTSALKVHLRVHSGIRPYPCEQCDKSFRQWGDLKYHITSLHSTEKIHQCEFCGKDFSRRYSLVVHRRIHTGERNYICEYCNKTFRACSYLQNHRRIHTGEKPHECNICGKKFRVRSDMKRHINTHTRNTNNKLVPSNNKTSNLEMKKEDDSSNNSLTNKSLIYSDKEIDIYRKKQQEKQQHQHQQTDLTDNKNNILDNYFKSEIDLETTAIASTEVLQHPPVITTGTSITTNNETQNLINIKLIKEENDIIQSHQMVIIHDNSHPNVPPTTTITTNTVNNESIFIFPVMNC